MKSWTSLLSHFKNHPLAGVAWLLFSGVAIYQAAAYIRVTLDDAYIFYKYAENIASGQGYVFNPGEKVLGTTSPLYTLVLAAGQFLLGWIPFFTLPRFGQGISVLSLVAIGLFIGDFFRRAGLQRGAQLAPLIMLAMAPFWNAVAMDVMPAMALGLFALDRYARGRMKDAAVLCALAVLTRPDLILIPGLVFLDSLAPRRRRFGWASLGLFVGLLLPWLVFSQLYFGTLIPSSISAKIGQANSGSWGSEYDFIRKSIKFWPFHVSIKDATLVTWAVASVLAAVGYRRFRNFREGGLVLVWIALYMFSYGFILKPAAYRWYYAPFAVGIAVMLTMGAVVAGTWLDRVRIQLGTAFTVVIMVWAGWVAADLATRTFDKPYNYKYLFYTEAAAWLNERAPEGAVVACSEIGAVGYFYQRGPILDLLGLVDNEVAARVRADDFISTVEERRPDFLLLKEPTSPVWDPVAYEPWFKDRYRRETVLGHEMTRLGVYRLVEPESADTESRK